jgi:hypothetical protein
MQLTTNGPSIMAIENITKRAEKMGINFDNFNLDADKYDHNHHNIVNQSDRSN